MTFPTSNLPINYRVPGVYVTEELGSELGSVLPNKRAIFFGIAPAASSKPMNVPWLPGTSAEVRNAHQPWSMITHIYEAGKSQLPAGIGAELWLCPLPEPASGTKATHLIKFLATPSAGALGGGSAAVAPDTCEIKFRGRGFTFGIDVGDTFADACAAAKAAGDLVPDLPVVLTITGGDTLVATDRSKGEHGNDMPVTVRFASKGAAGISASPGIVEYTGTATVGGSAVIGLNDHSATVTIGGSNTAVKSAQDTLAVLRADGYCVDAAIPGSPTDGKVTLFYRDGIPAHRIDITLVTVATQTAAAAVGVTGLGVPDLTSALNKLKALPAFRVYVPFWEDVTDWSATIVHVESEALVPKQKRQIVVHASTRRGEVLRAANLPDATTPKLTLSPRYNLGWQQGSPQAGFELAARYGAEVARQDYQAPNLNGVKLRTSDGVPLGVPDIGARPTDDEVNLMIDTYHYAPIGVDADGENAIIGSFTTYKATGTRDLKYTKLSGIYAVDYMADDLRAFLSRRFKQKSLKANGKPRSPRTVDPQLAKSAVFERLLYYDQELDIYDGAKEMRDAVMAGVLSVPNRINVAAPLRPVADLDQIDILATAE